MMKAVYLFASALLLTTLVVPVFAQDEEAFLPLAWDSYKETAVNTPAGALYLGFVLGTLQGANDNSLVLKHVPDDISIKEVLDIVGTYIDKHRAEATFKALPSSEIVIKAILAKYPAPVPSDHSL